MEKQEVLKETLKFLKENPKTQLAAIRGNIEGILERRGEIGSITTRQVNVTYTNYVDMSEKDAMLVNEVIFDLIAERVITPGIDRHNWDLPWISVTNFEKLNKKLEY